MKRDLMADAVTECVRALVERGVTRLDLLEILLCLAGDPQRMWGIEAIAEGARIDPKRAAEALSGLARAGMVQTSSDPDGGHHLDRDLDLGALQALRGAHARDRLRVVNTFYACNLDNLRSSVRAFKLPTGI